jgi:hypothetical protein
MPKKIEKTKVGSEYRVRGKEGKVYGEFNKKKAAKKRMKKGYGKKKSNPGKLGKAGY